MPTAFVTGGTGFVGVNLVRALREQGWDVTAIHRKTSDLRYLAATGARLVVADAADEVSVRSAMPDGVDVVFHVAADLNLWKYGNAAQTRTNVDGTRSVVAAALVRGAKRFVQTSSIAAFGVHDGIRIDETTPTNAPAHWVNYARTKWLADEEVRQGVERGLRAVIVHPANILGPFDTTGWARLFVLLKEGRLPGVPPGSGPWCHVRDVVAGHLAAAERGQTGESYLLGGPTARYAEIMALASRLLGVKPPPSVPRAAFRAIGRASQWWSAFSRRAPDVTPEIALLLGSRIDCSSARAERELGYSTTSTADMVRDTHDWLTGEGRL